MGGDGPGLSKRTQCNHKCPVICPSVTEEAEVTQRDRDLRFYATIFEDGRGAKRPGLHVAYRCWKGKKMKSPLEPPEGAQFC